jgi:hypothetical protein
MKHLLLRSVVVATTAALPLMALASSHKEAPFIASQPQVDGTDFYMFRSYEPGRDGFVTLIANYVPLQDPAGGPNFFALNSKALYQIKIDNNGDGIADLSFNFQFGDTYKNLKVPSNGKSVAVPLINIGAVDPTGANVNMTQSYSIVVQRGNQYANVGNSTSGGTIFQKPVDNIGHKSIPDYAAYAANFIYQIDIPGCGTPGRVFVGQRKEGFVVNLGGIFDLVNTNPVGPRDAEKNTLSGKNITSIALEVPTACLTNGTEPVIGGYTTASLHQARVLNYFPTAPGRASVEGGAFTQVSRLGMPLVNEVIIGLPDKDKFNASAPKDDAQFIDYVTNPTLPVLLNVLFGDAAKVPASPRNDLIAAFLTGVKGVNQPANVRPSELLRLNTTIAITAAAAQNDLGVLAGDNAGFPNGRRPYDDVVDIELRVAAGALCGKIGDCGGTNVDPNAGAPYTDGVRAAGVDAGHITSTGANPADVYLTTFPYLDTPLPGSSN